MHALPSAVMGDSHVQSVFWLIAFLSVGHVVQVLGLPTVVVKYSYIPHGEQLPN